jgi:Flp pilus assembly pilin Flp
MKRIKDRFAAAIRWTHAAGRSLHSQFSTETGQTLTEYALILALVAVAAVAALKLIGTDINTLLNTIASDLSQSG